MSSMDLKKYVLNWEVPTVIHYAMGPWDFWSVSLA